MAAKTNCEHLTDLKRQLYLTNTSGEPFRSALFMVLSIHRYLGDPRHCVQTGLTGSQSSVLDVIQLTVADSRNKMKLILSPSLNKLVQNTELQVGHEISITKARLHHDETDLSGSQVIIVEQLAVEGHRDPVDTDLGQLAWLGSSSPVEQMDIPLTSSRGYFVSVWSSMEMYGSIWKTEVPEKPCLEKVKVQDIYSIKDMARRWNSVKSANPALLVRVLMKSRVLHYAKPHKNDKWPFQAHVLVGDDTGTCTLILWNAMCPQLFYSLEEGSVLLLQKFTVKKSYQFSLRFKPAMKDKEHFNVDINLNSHHPVSEVTVVDPATIPDQINLPTVTYNFINRRQAGCLVDNYKCDVVGVVTYVGRYEREPIAVKLAKDYWGYYVRRWLHLMDGSSNKPFVIQLYRATEGMRVLDIEPGSVLVCSHLMVMRRLEGVHNSRTSHSSFFTSTAETQTRILDADLQSRLQGEKAVDDVVQWSTSRQCEDRLKVATLGGYYNVPVAYRSVEDLRTFMKDQQIVGSEEWQPLLSSLSYRECRQILVKANMVHVRCCLIQATRDAQKSPQKKIKVSQPECSVDETMEAMYKNSDSMVVLGATQLDPDTSYPTKYCPEHRINLKKKFQFPPCELEHSHSSDNNKDLPDPVPLPYFTVTWIGLNTQVFLQTQLFCSPDISKHTQFMDVICAAGSSQLSASSGVSCSLAHADAERVIATSGQCSGKQFVLLLDCYQSDHQNLEIFLNKAWALGT